MGADARSKSPARRYRRLTVLFLTLAAAGSTAATAFLFYPASSIFRAMPSGELPDVSAPPPGWRTAERISTGEDYLINELCLALRNMRESRRSVDSTEAELSRGEATVDSLRLAEAHAIDAENAVVEWLMILRGAAPRSALGRGVGASPAPSPVSAAFIPAAVAAFAGLLGSASSAILGWRSDHREVRRLRAQLHAGKSAEPSS